MNKKNNYRKVEFIMSKNPNMSEELEKQNDSYKKYVKTVATINIVLSVAIIVILLLKNFCVC